jgi:hypothetical protein
MSRAVSLWIFSRVKRGSQKICKWTTSIRVVKDEEFQPIMIIFGQDKSAFHQFLLKSKNLTGPKGACTLLPKSDSIAVMVSAIISCDTWFGLQLDSTKLFLDEQFSLQGKKYTNKPASMDVSRISKNCLSSNILSLQQMMKATGDTTIWCCCCCKNVLIAWR